jgi:2-dehydro-3-deoxy-D-arabinonate dehydratase
MPASNRNDVLHTHTNESSTGLRTDLFRTTTGDVVARRAGAIFKVPVSSVAELLRLPLEQIRRLIDDTTIQVASAQPTTPIDGRTEVWASGVTYQRSRAARMDESTDPDIYERVYAAERPELFFKAPAWRVVADGEPVGIREDSSWDVPEPELAVVVNGFGEIVGYGVCNDVSSRSLEGENPLYLPQAKVFAGACALGLTIRPAWELDANELPIRLTIHRNGAKVVDESTITSELARGPQELVDWLFRAENFPDGVWLSTGTGIVPPNDFTLREGDVVTVRIDGVGSTTNTVAVGRGNWAFLEQR